ncbi:MAG: coenzyme F420-0:L-glutamate ligase [Candidatus Paceibacterota bacterium]|jgi:coenzyme F420-0:L-glutamate ligase
MKVKAIKTRIFREEEDLISFILKYITKLPEKSVLVITSKIVALAEGRTVSGDKKLSKKAYEQLREKIIKSESELAIKTKITWLTIKNGMVMSSAGIDESNANGKIILLPRNSFQSAENVRKILKKRYKIKNLGVLITDSRIFPLRAGIVGAALGYAGFRAIRDYRGTKDIFGRILKMSRTDVGDSLATAAVLAMGEGRERQPLAVITEAPIEFTDKINKKELLIPLKDDLYLPLFRRILKK